MSKQTIALADLVQALAALGVEVETPAVTTKSSPAKPVTEPRYRTEAQKAKARAAADKVWAEAKAKAGVKRVSALPAKVQAECKAEVRAIWASTVGTRKTPVK